MRNLVRKTFLKRSLGLTLVLCFFSLFAPLLAQDQVAPPKTNPADQLNDSKSPSPSTSTSPPTSQDGREKAGTAESDKTPAVPSAPEKATEGAEPPATPLGTPLVVAGETVFSIAVRLGAYTPERRVASISKRLEELEQDPDFRAKIEQITTQDNDYSTDIVAGDQTLLTLTSLDAKAAGSMSRQELAKMYALKLKEALTKYVKERSVKNRFIAAGMTAALTFVLMGMLGLIGWLFPRTYRMVASWKGKHIRSLQIQQARLLSQETLTDVIIGMLRILRVLSVLFLLSVYTTLVLSFFPETRKLSGEMVNYFAFPIERVIWPAILSYLPNIAFQLVILFLTYYVITFTHFFFREVERKNITIDGFDPEWAESTYKIVRFLIITFSFVLIFPYLPGSGSPAFQQVSLFMGVLLSLGSTGAVSHVVAGVFLTYTGAFKLGDRVKIADTVGDVVEKTLLATRIRTIKEEYITIPNALVLGSHIINYSSSAKNPGLILHTTVTIGYNAPWQTVHKLLIDAALSTSLVLQEPKPFVLQTSLDDYYVSYQINAYTSSPHLMAAIYSEIHQNIQNKFNEAGVEIMSPNYRALREGNQSTIPPDYLSDSYQAPRFGLDLDSEKTLSENK